MGQWNENDHPRERKTKRFTDKNTGNPGGDTDLPDDTNDPMAAANPAFATAMGIDDEAATRALAFGGLSDHELEHVALHSPIPRVQNHALMWLQRNPRMLQHIAETDSDERRRRIAVLNLSADKPLMARIAWTNDMAQVRSYAFERWAGSRPGFEYAARLHNEHPSPVNVDAFAERGMSPFERFVYQRLKRKSGTLAVRLRRRSIARMAERHGAGRKEAVKAADLYLAWCAAAHLPSTH